MNYPADILFDIETLVNAAQPRRILLVGDIDSGFLHDYTSQKALLKQACEVHHVANNNLEQLWELRASFDVAIALNVFEHIDKTKGMQLLSRLRDVLSPQYCIALPLASSSEERDGWLQNDLFAFALSRVAHYARDEVEYALFKYNIDDYKKTPDWLNADNWANPQMWGKYWW